MSQVKSFYDPNINENVTFRHEGDKVIYQLRRAYKLGVLAVDNNLPADIQTMLNKPLTINKTEYSFTTEDKEFLKNIINKIKQGKIQLYTPSTLLNQKVYKKLSSHEKGKADFNILNLLNKIREIKKLWDSGETNTYQILNLVKSLRLIKKRIEIADGDVFII